MRFRDEYYFLSNMYPCAIWYEDTLYKSVETVFQMMKCSDDNEKKGFESLNGFEAKKRGRRVKLRSDWHEVKVSVMREILERKFELPELEIRLNKQIADREQFNDDNEVPF